MTAAESWIMDIRTMAEVEKQRVVDRAKNHLLEALESRFLDIEVFRERAIVPEEILEVMGNNAFNEFAWRAAKIVELNFEFSRTSSSTSPPTNAEQLLKDNARLPLS